MNLEQLVTELQAVRTLIEDVDPNSIQADDLAILELKIQRKIAVSGFDPLADIPLVAVPDFTELRALAVELKKAIADERKRVALVNKILGVAKTVATVAGLPIL